MKFKAIFITIAILALTLVASAQNNLAAVMTVQSGVVEVQRVNTDQWIPVSVEAIVGVGDSIRTDETGQALITFFQDGVDTTLEPSTEYRIEAFSGNTDTFTLSVSVLAGQTRQRFNRVLDSGSNYDVQTPGVNLVARGTVFDVRVENDGRSSMLVSEGVVGAEKETASAEVPAEFGIRAEVDGTISDVVRADNFDQLDSGLDGCSATLTTPDDVRINVRSGAALDYPIVGSVFDDEVTNLKGTTETGDWYRIDFRSGFGWVLSSSAELQGGCAGLRIFENGFGPEDVTQYEFLGDPVSLEDVQLSPTPTEPAPATEEATTEEGEG